MILNITAFSLLAFYKTNMLLSGPDVDKGFLRLGFSDGPLVSGLIQVGPLSPLLQQTNLRQICFYTARRSRSPFPLYRLVKRNHSNFEMFYHQACHDDCMDLYLECLDQPFKLEKTGDVRVSFESQWSALCLSPPLTIDVAKDMCKRLGKPGEIAEVLTGRAGNYTTTRTLSVNCDVVSSQQSCRPLFSTSLNNVLITDDDCSEDQLVAINCSYEVPHFKIKRENDVPRGVLQIQVADSLLNLCPSGFNLNQTRVICRSQGYPSSDANYNLHILRQRQPCRDIRLGSVRCVGDEPAFEDCPNFRGLGNSFGSTSNRVVNISCSTAFEFKTRVTGGFDGISGRLEVYHAGRWGTVCRNGFGQSEANAACISATQGMMGQGSLMLSPAEVAPETTVADIWLDNVDCLGKHFEHCNHSPWGEHVCSRNEIVYLQCSEPPVFKITERSGLLVYHNGEWGGVCAYYFTSFAARAVCRTLRLPSKVPSWSPLERDGLSRRIWLERLDCDHNSVDVNMCSGWDWGKININCRSVAVSCKEPEESDVSYSLVEMGSQEVGVVELQYRGEPRYICSGSTDNNMARVACRSLRLPEDNAQLIPVPPGGLNLERIWISDMFCTGQESSLLACTFDNIGLTSTPWDCHHTKVLAVSCGKSQVSGESYPLRLTGGVTEKEGTLEAQVHGVWGGVCRPDSPKKVEAVVCRQLGYVRGISRKFPNGNGTGTIAWLDNVHCSGDEEHISDCELSVGPHLSCRWRTAVKCSDVDTDAPSDDPVGAIVAGTVVPLMVILLLGPVFYALVCGRRKKKDNTPIQPRAPVGQRIDARPSRAEVPRHQHEPRPIPDAPSERHEDVASQPSPYVIPLIPTRPQSADEGLPPSYDQLFPNGEPKSEVLEFEA